jgi:hypothetical protein
VGTHTITDNHTYQAAASFRAAGGIAHNLLEAQVPLRSAAVDQQQQQRWCFAAMEALQLFSVHEVGELDNNCSHTISHA